MSSGDGTWRLKIHHTCDTARLRQAAISLLKAYQQNASSATVVHREAAGIDVVDVQLGRPKHHDRAGVPPGHGHGGRESSRAGQHVPIGHPRPRENRGCRRDRSSWRANDRDHGRGRKAGVALLARARG